MVELKNIDLSYGEQSVLKGFTLSIAEGEKVALMGRSGAGKTSIMRLILGLIMPDSGTVEAVNGAKYSAVFQEDRLIEPLSAVANCRLAMPKNAPEGAAPAMLSRLGIDDNISRKPVRELSGGEKRRTAIARALLTEHSLLLLDEPFKGIDAETLPAVLSAVAEDPAALLLITHSDDEADAFGCRVVNI